MNPENQLNAQAKRCEDIIQELDEILHFLKWQLSRIEVRVHSALEQLNTVDLSP